MKNLIRIQSFFSLLISFFLLTIIFSTLPYFVDNFFKRIAIQNAASTINLVFAQLDESLYFFEKSYDKILKDFTFSFKKKLEDSSSSVFLIKKDDFEKFYISYNLNKDNYIRTVDFYIVDKNGIVFDSSDSKKLNFDFSENKTFWKVVSSSEYSDIVSERITIDKLSSNYF